MRFRSSVKENVILKKKTENPIIWACDENTGFSKHKRYSKVGRYWEEGTRRM